MSWFAKTNDITFCSFKGIQNFKCGNHMLYNSSLSFSRHPQVFILVSISSFCLVLPETLRFITTGVEVNWKFTAFTFGLLKTGDKKPARGKESRILKGVIYHICQNSAECWDWMKKRPRRLENVVCCQYFNPAVSTLCHTLLSVFLLS